jgi:hypothetical protein
VRTQLALVHDEAEGDGITVDAICESAAAVENFSGLEKNGFKAGVSWLGGWEAD